MSASPDALKVKKDAAVSALFSLYKAAGDASSAVLDLINYLEGLGLDVSDLHAAFTGVPLSRAIPEGGSTASKGKRQREEPKEPATASLQNDAKDPVIVGGHVGPTTLEYRPTATPEVDSGKKKPKPKAPKDPNAPKRPLNAFLKFRNQEFKKITEERKSKGEPDLSRADMSAAIKEHWENLPESVRENLVQEGKAELERYFVDVASYKESTGGEPLTQLDSSQLSQAQPASQADLLTGESSSQPVLTQEGESASGEQPQKKKQKKKDDGKKEEKEKKKRKKQQTSE